MIQNKALPPFKSYPPSRKDPAACRGELDLFNTRYWLYLFIIFHLVGWTLVPAVIRHNLPIDSIEGSIWGQQLEWGYDKNPFLNGWLTALAIYLSHRSDWMIYFFSQLSVVICFLSVWHLARTILPATLALLAVLLLEGVQYYNFHAIDFNDNTLELSLFSLTIYFFYQALRTKTYRAWCATGCFAALCLMAKYYAIVLFIPMFLFLLLYPENRDQLKTIRPYCGLLLFILIILPHFIWLFSNDFVTVRYAFERVGNPPSWRNHLFFPLQFAWQQLEVFLPALFLFGIFFIGKKPFLAPQKNKFFQQTIFILDGPWSLPHHAFTFSFIWYEITRRMGHATLIFVGHSVTGHPHTPSYKSKTISIYHRDFYFYSPIVECLFTLIDAFKNRNECKFSGSLACKNDGKKME